MSQLLQQRPKDRVLYSELHFPRPAIQLTSSAKEVSCQFCKSEIRETNPITARRVGGRLVMACASHKF